MSQTIFPAVRYADADAGLQFLKAAFGAEEHVVYRGGDGRIQHAEIRINGEMIMFGGYDDSGFLGGEKPDPLRSTLSLYVVELEPDAHCERAVKAGATLVRPLQDTPYGSREYSVRDIEGNVWSFGTYDPATHVEPATETAPAG